MFSDLRAAVVLFGVLPTIAVVPLIGADHPAKASTRQPTSQPEVIRDHLGKMLGTTRPTSNGRLEARSPLGALLGTYDPKTNLTRDRLGRVLTKGNTPSALAVRSATPGKRRFARIRPALRRWKVKRILPFIVLIALAFPALAQRADVSVVGGGGFVGGEEQDTHGLSAVGATIGFPYSGRHRIQFDYLFNNVHVNDSARRHFVTGSYVVQGAAGRTRPFFQIGAGFVRRSFRGYRVVGATKILWFDESDSSFAAVFGGPH
jgi:hypothetical protein